ncbi:efflux RND transporter permease subunit [Hyphomicrobium sp.]|uniref:efflux RND transporter permease subunit n=1 Tax=Hyphomicrobium sp. TaxID=82 RepID=UPI002E318938|nr:efflux RND transporter permease subunit [Hyphomicrobium sp.]HEX2843543.1 efflux RND transporter permease subunit [Hyphomicrobium sp.]
MGLSEFCIRRPVFATVLSLVIVLLGVVSYTRLTVREYPNVDEPVVSVQTRYPGASAKIIESQVTQILEGSLAGISGIDVLESSSRSEDSRITVRFRPEVNQDVAASDVRDRVSRVRGRLPDEIDEPVIAKVEADAQPVMMLVFTSPVLNPLEISDYVDRFVVDQLKNLNGVADVTIYGERRYAMRIWVDRERLAAFALTVQDIETALRAQNVELPSGRIESANREFSVLSRTGLVTPEEFRNIVIKVSGSHQVKLGEVARVELGAFDERRESRWGGKTAIAVGVIKQAVANPLDVSLAVRALLPKINQSMPNGMQADVGNDDSIFIERSIQAVYHTIGEAILLVVLVIVFFLRSFRASLIPIVTIPISLIATFTLMLMFGFSVNTLTLLAMVLAIGLVVDDAIVVLENVYRHIEHGMKPVEAAIKGTREIGFAVIAMTLTLAAVYAPIAFAPGKTGRLFLEFALTLAGAVIISGFVALTLTPMMCSRLLRHNPNPGRTFLFVERLLTGLENGYRRTLRIALANRPVVLLLAVAVAGSCYFFFTNLKAELAPVEDRGVLRIRGTGPEGATLAYISRYSAQADELLADLPEVKSRLVINGNPEVSRFLIFAPLKDWSERERTQQELTRELTPKTRQIAGAQTFVQNPGAFGQRGNARPVEFVLQSSGTYEEIQALSDKLVKALEGYGGLESLETDLKLNTPEFRLEMDRAKVSDLRLDVNVVGRTLETLLGGRQVTRFEMNGEQYDVMVQLAERDRSTPAALDTIFLRSPSGEMIQLSNIVKVIESVAPKELKRFNQLRSVTLSANIAPGYALGEVLDHLEKTALEVLPKTVQTDVNGQSRDYRASSQSLALVFVLALAFIYLVLAAQFESFRDPLIILITVPLSMCGALGMLYLVGGSLNVYSQIGLVTLVGLITKHGILIVEFANQLEAEGRRRTDAVIEAASLRLRPILMTTGAMVLGAVPLALAVGAGAESRQQIGWVIVGGMSLGTVLTLYVVPTVLSMIGSSHRRTAEPGGEALPAE